MHRHIATSPHRHIATSPHRHIFINSKVFIAVALMALMFTTAIAQPVEPCHAPDPTDAEFAEMLSQVPAFQSYAQNRNQQSMTNVPLCYHVVRSNSLTNNITPNDIDNTITSLNSIFSGTGLNFYRLGEPNYLDYTNFGLPSNLWIFERYSYVKTALNVYLGAQVNAAPNPTNANASNLFHLRELNISSISTLGGVSPITGYSLQAHEIAHTLGLLHTFGSDDKYIYPATLSQVDYPEWPGPLDIPVGFRPRELAIRQSTTGNIFNTPNCDYAGDLCCDTEADCRNDILAFPLFNASGVNCSSNPTINCSLPGCTRANCQYTGGYRDYNGIRSMAI